MLIGRVNNWYRPYRIIVNNKTYTIRQIHFYNAERIIVSSNSGWLETRQGDIKEVELPTEEIKLKRKVKLDGTVFIISKGKFLGDEIEAYLYIPADMLNIHFVEHKIMYSTQIRAIYEGEQGIYITSYVKTLNDNLMSIREEYEKVYKELSDTSLSVVKSEIVLANIDRLKELAEEFIAERERIHNLTIDDIEI